MNHRCTYDDHDRCFECDKPMTKAAMMSRLRKERAEAGMVELRLWLTKDHRELVKAYINQLKEVSNEKTYGNQNKPFL